VDNQQKYLRFTSVGSSNCISFGLSSFSQKEGYLVQVNTRHIEGKYLSISIVNNDTRRAFLETQIDTPADSSAFVPSYFVIPPMDPYGLGYTITIDNVAIGSQKTINDLARVSVYQLSYAILSDLKIQQSNTVSTSSASTSELSVSHPNPAYYKVVIGNNGSPIRSGMTNTLILSQSFDNGWKAYSINNPIIQYTNNPIIKWIGESLPFVFGTEFTNHVLVNNWENGWELPEAEVHGSKFIVQGNTNQPSTMNNEPITIILFFWPQLLEYLGFLLLPIPFIYVWRLKYVEKH
jgi:hypothetical protein